MPKKILVVEDNVDSRELMHLHLTTEGFSVVIAANGQEGLYMANAEHPDLIITDIEMPELNGLDLVKELRAQPETRDIPIIVLSALGNAEMDKAIRAGADRAMHKPVLLDGLADESRDLLARSNTKDRQPPD